mgnify:CR=1 FL=1
MFDHILEVGRYFQMLTKLKKLLSFLNFGGEKPSFGKYFDIFLRFPKTGRQKEVIS